MDPLDLDPDPGLDPVLFVSDLHDANKKCFLYIVFCLLLFDSTFTSFFQDNKS